MAANINQTQLKALLASASDEKGNHILWVDCNLDVHLSRVPTDQAPNGFESSQPTMIARLETFGTGNGYVGPLAAEDSSFVMRLLAALQPINSPAPGDKSVLYIGDF